MRNPLAFYGGIPAIPQYEGGPEVSPRLVSTSVNPIQEQTFRYGGLVTYEKPIREFPEEIVIGASSVTTLRAGNELPNNCVGMRFIGLTASVVASINGGGTRTILNGDVLNGCEIDSIMIVTDATGGCIVQPVGTGD